MLNKILKNLKEGTLLQAVCYKLRLDRSEVVDHDHYHGDIARDYLKKRLKQEMWHREQEVVQQILEPFPNDMKVLDVPFGTGRFVDMLLKKQASIYGIDISQDMLETAKAELGEKWDQCSVEVGSADDLPYDDKYFDLAICFRFFGLIPLRMARVVLQELSRTCHGKVIIRVPVQKSPQDSVTPLGEDDLIQGNMTRKELVSLFTQYGFGIEDERSVGEREKIDFVVFVLGKL